MGLGDYMQKITKDSLSSLSYKEFSILLFYAKGCHHCEKIKPVFEAYSERYPDIGFYKADVNENLEYYNRFAEDAQEVVYGPLKDENGKEKKDVNGNTQMVGVLQFNEDGSPKMAKKWIVPGFYVHHIDAINPNNPYGFIGGWDGSETVEVESVLNMIEKFRANR